jgi:putative membrane protein
MMYWDGDWNAWAWFAMTLSMIAFWTVVGLVVWMMARRASTPTAAGVPSPSAEEVLRQRYAAGEIDEAEFERRKTTLRSGSVVAADR